MSVEIFNMEQGTEEWFEVRKGVLTASNATAIGNIGAGLKTYVKSLVLDMVVEEKEPHYTGPDIERGNELEPIARLKYEFDQGVKVDEVGFIRIANCYGCSPDGLVGEDGGIEIKARNNNKHLDHLLGAPIDSGTHWQIQMSLLVTSRTWWDFISYNPNFKNSLHIERIYKDEKKIEKLIAGIKVGSGMIQEEIKKLKKLKEI